MNTATLLFKGRYVTEVKLEYLGVSICIMAGPYVDQGKASSQAVADFQQYVEQIDQYRAYATAELLALYNDTWRDEADPVLSPTEFSQKLVNPRILLFDELGAASIYFHDSGMFGGHVIDINLDRGKARSVDLAG
jgi:hypothetical protein